MIALPSNLLEGLPDGLCPLGLQPELFVTCVSIISCPASLARSILVDHPLRNHEYGQGKAFSYDPFSFFLRLSTLKYTYEEWVRVIIVRNADMAGQSSVTKTAGNKRRPTGLHVGWHVLETGWLIAVKKWFSAVLRQTANRPRLKTYGRTMQHVWRWKIHATVSAEILNGKYHLETKDGLKTENKETY